MKKKTIKELCWGWRWNDENLAQVLIHEHRVSKKRVEKLREIEMGNCYSCLYFGTCQGEQ
jgi:hypothetical protein